MGMHRKICFNVHMSTSHYAYQHPSVMFYKFCGNGIVIYVTLFYYHLHLKFEFG